MRKWPGPGTVLWLLLLLCVGLSSVGLVSAFIVDMLCLLTAAWTAANLPGGAKSRKVRMAVVVVALASALLGFRLLLPDIRYMPYLLVFPANLLASVVFARGLLPGREPVLLALIRLMGIGSTQDPLFVSFVRGQCLLWAVVSFMTAILALICIPFSVSVPEFKGALSLLIAAQIIWFPLSHVYASWRYQRRETFVDTIVTLIRPEARTLLVFR